MCVRVRVWVSAQTASQMINLEKMEIHLFPYLNLNTEGVICWADCETVRQICDFGLHK